MLGIWNVESKGVLIAVMASVLYAVANEWHQAFVQGQFKSAADVLLNTTGAVIAAVLLNRSAGIETRGGQTCFPRL